MTPMPFSRPILEANVKIDFYASSEEALVLVKSIHKELPEERRGNIYDKSFGNYLPGDNPLVVTNPDDLTKVFYAGEERAFIFVEDRHYKQTRGLLATVSLFLCRDEKDAVIRRAFTEKYQEVKTYTTHKQLAQHIITYVVGVAPKYRNKIGSDSLGLIYMAFGDKAGQAVKKSVATLKRIGFSYPVCVVGDKPVDGFEFRKWEGESPFDPTQKKNFMFRAGRIKPFLYELSPFDRTLYLDADTQFIQDPHKGFEYLSDYDIALTQEYLTVGELYNKFMAGWEINIEERAQTIKEGINPDERFINSGVIFFKKSSNNEKVFKEWHKQWMRFQQWDEQLALMRALNLSMSSRKYLEPMWNDPQVHDNTIIFHDYGHGHVRMNV